ncbi:MAG: sigma-70 region 4 domain-containing protein [Clostridiales bacterium]|nr:sigma-70 region 4 domain-containing protein [Clostridiales bacterium]
MNTAYDIALENESLQAYGKTLDWHSDFRQRVLDPTLQQIIKNELTKRQQECIYLVVFKNMSQYQAARFLGLSQPTVNQHLRLAMKKMHTILNYCENTAQKSQEFYAGL